MALLTQEAFKATMGEPMRAVEEPTALPSDFWDYFDSVPETDFGGRDFGQGEIGLAYRDPSGRFDHVLLRSEDPDVFLAVVISRSPGQIHGHYLLDLPKEYGLQ